ncbi:MAG: outer membrane channel protein TolC [Gammaproteobacteria bacterium]|nr:MAG: outer membrane channel protein TolC [Gammaproteobacteria bacterium]
MNRIITSILFASLTLFATSSRADNLLSIYRLAQQSDPQVRAAAANMQATREARPQSIANMLPNLSVTADTIENDQKTTGTSFFSNSGRFNTNSYTISLVQPIFHFEYYSQYKQAGSTVSRADAEYLTAQQELIVRVARAYFDVLGAIDNLRFTEQERKAISRQLEQAQQRFEVGLIAITDVHEARAAYDQAVAQQIDAENLRDSQREQLQAITGKTHMELSLLKEDIPLLKPEPADMSQWVETAQAQNPAILAARHASEEARQDINIARSAHLPTLDVVATRRHSESGGTLARETDLDTIGLQLNMSLFEGGRVVSRTRQASYQFNEASENLELQHRNVTRQTRDAYRGVIAGISRIKAFKQAVVSNNSALQATEAGFEVGTRTIVDVLISQRNLYRSERDLARSRYDYLIQTLSLKQAAGTLDISDLEKMNGWFK